jgi:hypothetical protein
MKNLLLLTVFAGCSCCFTGNDNKIDRKALVGRNSPVVTTADTLSSLTVGNGLFAMTVDVTGLQTFPEDYRDGVPLGTQSEWGWHSFPNPNGYTHEETMKEYNFRGRTETYAVQTHESKRKEDAAKWFRINPHRLHLGTVGLEITNGQSRKAGINDLTQINQKLDLWEGMISSSFNVGADKTEVKTVCHPEKDVIAASVSSPLLKKGAMGINLRFPYPTGGHSDDACDWQSHGKHATTIIESDENYALLERRLDDTKYYVSLQWEGNASLIEKEIHYFVLLPLAGTEKISFTCTFSPEPPIREKLSFSKIAAASARHWEKFWKSGAAVDFSACTDPRAPELERRVVLSQYLMAIQCAGHVPPQESGLTYNTWFGRPHLEMHWWHGAHFALWGRPELLERSLAWYSGTAYSVAKQIAKRQGFDGVRWMKMTDPWANEAPSDIGSFLIWQQPHIIYFAELMYRANPTQATLDKYLKLVIESAEFMVSFLDYDPAGDRYILQGLIAAQETLQLGTINPPMELSYWHFGLSLAQKWLERTAGRRNSQWDTIIEKLSPLAKLNGLYLAAENATDTYTNIRYTSDHMAVLGALGMLPQCPLFNADEMSNTLAWIWDNWNWDRTWGWDFPMVAMNAARLGEPEKAVGALLMDKRTNTYLVNGHNYQDKRLRVYLPGNGGLLTAIAMMCAGWEGAPEIPNPGFPQDGSWNVRSEGLMPML